MGGLISSCQTECFHVSTALASAPWNSYRFAAEIYKLSNNRREWVKVYPDVLSITVRGQDTPGGQIAELDAVNLRQENVCRFVLNSHNEIRRCSERFVYWKGQDGGVYALNVVSRSDVDNLCSLVASTSSAQPTSGMSHRFHVQLAKMMTLRGKTVVEMESLMFTDAFLMIHPPDALAFLDVDNNCMLCASMVSEWGDIDDLDRMKKSECLISTNEAKNQLALSFPSRSFAIRFQNWEDLKRFCHVVLNESSKALAGSEDGDEVVKFLKRRLNSISTRIGAYKNLSSIGRNESLDKKSLEGMCTIKYSLIYRIASMRELLPKSNLQDLVYPPNLRARVPSAHVCHWIHLYTIAIEDFSMKAPMEIFVEKEASLDTETPISSLKELSHRDTFDKLPLLPACNTAFMPRDISEERLYKSIVELVQTEESFVGDLEKLIHQYILPGDLNFFEPAEKLHKTHASFLSALRDAGGDLLAPSNAFAPLNYAQIKDAVMRISALFINRCNSFKVYSEYSVAYLRFQHLQNDPLMKRRFSGLNFSGQQRESIQSMLIKPIQRVLK